MCSCGMCRLDLDTHTFSDGEFKEESFCSFRPASLLYTARCEGRASSPFLIEANAREITVSWEKVEIHVSMSSRFDGRCRTTRSGKLCL